jgi:2-octaprenylphenol hydroxylase
MRRRRVAPVEAMRIWDENGSGFLEFNAADMAAANLAWIIENSVIQTALVERLQQFTNVHYLAPVEIADIALHDDRGVVRLGDDRVLEAKLLIGADGAESVVRHAAGIATQRLALDQTATVATVTTEHAHSAIARQRFLTTGPLAFLPLNEPNTCSIVWSADTVRAEELAALDDATFLAELQVAFGDVLGLIRSVSPRATFALALSHAQRYTAERVALIGDAAHTVHPLAGQGVNIGFLDAATLAEVLLEAVAQKRDLGAHRLLRRYERARKADDLATVALTGGFRYLFSNRLPVVRELRNHGLDLANRLPPLKRLLMRRANGLVGEIPRLVRRSP